MNLNVTSSLHTFVSFAQDPKHTRIIDRRNVSDLLGISGELQLSEHPRLGFWTIQVKSEVLQSVLKYRVLTINAPIPTKVVCFSRLLKCLRSLYGKRCAPRTDCSVCSGSTLFASLLNSSVMLGNYLQQTTSADDIFRCIFFRQHNNSYIKYF